MNALAPFAPILALSIGSFGYLLGGKVLEKRRLTGVFAALLVAMALILLLTAGESTAGSEFGLLIDPFSRLLGVVACASGLVSILGSSSLLFACANT